MKKILSIITLLTISSFMISCSSNPVGQTTKSCEASCHYEKGYSFEEMGELGCICVQKELEE